MKNCLKKFFLLSTLLFLASCGLRAPKASLLQAKCPPDIESSDAASAAGIFFMSTSLTDCRHPMMKLAKYRGAKVSYGQSDLKGPIAEPWKAHESRLFTQGAWLEALEDRVKSGDNNGRLLIFIHGFNNNYEDALERSHILRQLYFAQVPTVAISWPSRNRVQSYIYDEASIGWSQPDIGRVIAKLSNIGSDITLVAHSMGGRAVLSSIQRLNIENPDSASNIRRLILIAPDVDRHRVLREGGEIDELLKFDREVLIYVSQKDFPIRISRFLHGYSRLGSSDCRYDVDYSARNRGRYGNCHLANDVPRLWVVETAGVSRKFGLRHADVFDNCAGRADLSAFLQGKDPSKWRDRIGIDGRVGWRISPRLFHTEGTPCG